MIPNQLKLKGLFIFVYFLWCSSVFSENENQKFSSYFKLIEKAEIEVEKDSAKAFALISEIKLDQLPITDSSFNDLAYAKLDFLGTYYLPSFFDEEVSMVINRFKADNALENLARLRSYLSEYYMQLNLLDSSYHNVSKAIRIYEQLNQKEKIGELLLTKAIIYYSQDEYIKSIETVFDAVDHFEGEDQNKQMAFAYLQIGSTYLYINYLDEAEEYYELAGNYFLKLEDTLGHAICQSNLGLIEFERHNYENAIALLKKAQIHILKSKRQIMIAFAYQAIGECYVELGELDSALHYTGLSFSIDKKLQYNFGVTKDYYLLAKIKQKSNQLDSALIYANHSLKLLELEEDLEIEYDLSLLLADLYQELNEIEKSNFFLRRRIEVMDSLKAENDYINQLSLVEKDKLKDAEYALNIAQEKESLNLKKNELQTDIILLLIILLTGIFSGSIFLFITNRSNKTLNQELTRELNKNQSLIMEIHHRVKNNLQIVASMLNMQAKYVDNEKMKEILAECRARIKSMGLIHESLYKDERNEAPLFNEYVKQLIPLLVETYQIDESKIILKMDVEEFRLSIDESIPCGLLINEVISNSLKHAFPKDSNGQILIKMSISDNRAKLRISDNGIGLSKNFDASKQNTFGFLLIHTLADQLEAKVNIDSTEGLSIEIEWTTRS